MTDETKNTAAATAAPSLSVVIPFYNDEVYLEEAIRSAVAQPISDLEVIVVNDNPGERSTAFLDALADRYAIRVEPHATNRGLAAARNTGIEAATKDFVTFIDADDTFVAGALATNLAFAAECGSDITHTPTLSMFVGRLHPGPLRRDWLLFGREIRNTTIEECPQAQYIVSSWSSIYRRAFLNEKSVRFDEAQRKFEDRLFVLDALFAANTISFSAIAARIWRRRLGSITTGDRAFADIAMQMALLTKCIESAKRYAGAAGDRSIILQRELNHSICRVIWDVRVLHYDPDICPELEEARQALTKALQGLELRREVFADHPTMIISHLNKVGGRYGAVTRSMLIDAFEMVRDGKWKALYNWREAQRLPPNLHQIGGQKTTDKELILHIGLHKTGSTFLQRILERDRARLAEAGILFPETGFLGTVADNQRGAATPGHVGFPGALRHNNPAPFKRLRAEVEASDCDQVLISAENLSFPFDTPADRAVFLERAESYLGFFKRRRIIGVFRRPDEYIDRYYREHVFLATGWARRTAEQFAAELGPQMTDLRFLTGDWRAFAGGHIDLISYEAARARGLEAHFYDALGVAAPEGLTNGGATYPSPSPEQVLAGRMIAMARIEKHDKSLALGEFLAATAKAPRQKGFELFSPETRLRLIDEFAQKSSSYLADLGIEVPIDDWRTEADTQASLSGALAPEYMDAAINALANVAEEPFTPQPVPPTLSLYRFLNARFSRFW
ncbi:MAG: glycosyltransferase family 2 protein [Pseudomonadota bacterium]